MEDQNRDSRGRFVHGHNPISLRDMKTGKFIRKEQTNPSSVESQVDHLIQQKGITMEQALKRWRSESKEKI